MNKVENTVTKGEIARFEQFLLLSQCFQKSSAEEASESVCMWKRDKSELHRVLDQYSPNKLDAFLIPNSQRYTISDWLNHYCNFETWNKNQMKTFGV